MSKLEYQRIILLREFKDLTQADLAELAGIEPSYVSKLERGKAPNAAGIIVAKLARALETTTDYLLGLSDDPNPNPPPNSPVFLDSRFRDIMDVWQLLTDLEFEPGLTALHKLALAFRITYEAKQKPPEG